MGIKLQYFAALSSSLGALSAGCALGWTSNLEWKIRSEDYGILLADFEFSLLGSMLNFGAAMVCILMGLIINWIGRRRTMILIVIPFIAGWVLLVTATNIYMLIIGRTLVGIGCGSVCVCCPVYVGEIAENKIRGTLGTFFQLFITSGILMVYVLGAFTSAQVTSGVCAVVPIIFVICILFCPESPTYYIMKDKKEEAMAVLKRLRDDDTIVQRETNELIKEELNRRSQNTLQAFYRKSSKKAIIIAFGLMFFQQLSGINAVIFYTNAIFTDANVELKPQYATILIGVIQVIATLGSTLVVDRVGRKILLMASFSLMALCTLSLGIFYAVKGKNEESVDGFGWICLLALCLFIVAFSIGAGPLPWLCLSEIFASDIRAIAGSLTGTLNWTLAFAVTATYPPVREKIGPSACFIAFAVLSLIGSLFAKFVVPETKGISNAEIQKLLGDE